MLALVATLLVVAGIAAFAVRVIVGAGVVLLGLILFAAVYLFARAKN